MTQAGSAQPVGVSILAPDGGPALRVAVVSDGRPMMAGASQPIVVVSDGRPTQGNEPIPVVLGVGPVLGGTPIPVVVVSGSLNPNPQLGAATVAALNTTVTNDMSPDGLTWAAVRAACIVDAFGKLIVYAQRYNANTRQCYFVYSNNNGVTWSDNTGIAGGEGFLTRGDIVYDAARDCLHGLIMTTNPGDGGIIYRRYSITRDGSNNITSIARVAGVSVSLDSSGTTYEFPTIRMTDVNTLLIAWTVAAALGGEIRTCKCDISGDADAGGTASNWVHIGINSVSLIGALPVVGSYTIPFTTALTASVTYFSLLPLVSGDLRWVYHNGSAPGAYFTRRSVQNAANTWNSLSAPVSLSNVQRAGTDTGYSLKNQLISQQSEKSGVVYVGLATWKDNTLGDTWGIYQIAANDSLTTSGDVYSANGAHSYAPTGDCAYDATADRLVVTYEQTATQDGYVGLLRPSDLGIAQAFSAFEVTTDIDIPVIARARMNGNVLILWRVAGAPPQAGRSAQLPWQ